MEHKSIKIKQSWEEVTISDFLKINQIVNRHNSKTNMPSDEIDFIIEIISVLTGLSTDEVEGLSVPEFNELSEVAMFIKDSPKKAIAKTSYQMGEYKFIFPGSAKIQIDATVREMKAIQYIDALHLAGNDNGLLDNIHTLMAVILKREGGPEYNDSEFSVSENAEIIKNSMSIVDALSVQAFFLQLSEVLTGITRNSLESRKKKQKKNNKRLRSLIPFLRRGDGSKT